MSEKMFKVFNEEWVIKVFKGLLIYLKVLPEGLV